MKISRCSFFSATARWLRECAGVAVHSESLTWSEGSCQYKVQSLRFELYALAITPPLTHILSSTTSVPTTRNGRSASTNTWRMNNLFWGPLGCDLGWSPSMICRRQD